MAMNPVVHFEMPAVDRKRMCEFYTKVFGWKTTGGKLSGTPEDIPGIGRWASIIDSEGNRVSILQPKMQ